MRWYIRVLHLMGIVVALAFSGNWVVREKHGPVVLSLTKEHGVHLGDIPVLVLGALVIAVLGVRLLRDGCRGQTRSD